MRALPTAAGIPVSKIFDTSMSIAARKLIPCQQIDALGLLWA